jgi:hypothetical protein
VQGESSQEKAPRLWLSRFRKELAAKEQIEMHQPRDIEFL